MSAPVEYVRGALRELQRVDPDGRSIFGASSHGWVLEAAVSEAVLADFEATIGIRLPEEYRDFVTGVGNGGAGPFYGLFRLGEMDDDHDFKKWGVGPREMVHSLETPFPHTASWNLSDEALDALDDDETGDLELEYLRVVGAIPICHEGCALRDWLVVRGPETGRVWHDATADRGGWSPWTNDDGSHMTFREWYLSWLDAAVTASRRGTAGRFSAPRG